MLLPLIAMALAAPVQGQAAGTPATAAPKDPAKMICRRFAETGSLVRKRKVCHTKEEWARINELDQSGARRFVEDNSGRPPGGP